MFTEARDFARAVRGPMATPEIVSARRAICEACELVDAAGVRLFRCSGEVCFCGAPRLQKIVRDARVDGCGCRLGFKWRCALAHCPHGKW